MSNCVIAVWKNSIYMYDVGCGGFVVVVSGEPVLWSFSIFCKFFGKSEIIRFCTLGEIEFKCTKTRFQA